MQIKWYHILVLALAVILGYYLGYKGNKTIVRTVYQDKPVYSIIDSIIYKTDTLMLPSEPIDTQAVVEDYFTSRSFDTTVVVNEVKLTFGGTVFNNKLHGLDLSVANFRPTQVVEEVKWALLGGTTVGNNIVAPTLEVQYGKHQAGVGYNLVGDNQIFLTYKYRLWQN